MQGGRRKKSGRPRWEKGKSRDTGRPGEWRGSGTTMRVRRVLHFTRNRQIQEGIREKRRLT